MHALYGESRIITMQINATRLLYVAYTTSNSFMISLNVALVLFIARRIALNSGKMEISSGSLKILLIDQRNRLNKIV